MRHIIPARPAIRIGQKDARFYDFAERGALVNARIGAVAW
jgi:hypothetical protein